MTNTFTAQDLAPRPKPPTHPLFRDSPWRPKHHRVQFYPEGLHMCVTGDFEANSGKFLLTLEISDYEFHSSHEAYDEAVNLAREIDEALTLILGDAKCRYWERHWEDVTQEDAATALNHLQALKGKLS